MEAFVQRGGRVVFLPLVEGLSTSDLLRRIRRLATTRGWKIEVSEGANHTKVRLNARTTVVSRHAVDLRPGTFRKLLKDLGLNETDLEV